VSLPPPGRDRTTVVTGASSGIGAALARELARRGHHVTLVARRARRLDALAADLARASPYGAEPIPCDLTSAGERAELSRRLDAGPRFVAGLCNNAGMGSFGRLHEVAPGRERAVVALNVEALHDLTLALLPGMVERGRGAILNVGSIGGFQPLPWYATYSATKAFANTFSEALHEDLRGTGVSSTLLCPGYVATEFAEGAGLGHMRGAGPRFAWTPPEAVARAGIDAMSRGSRRSSPGLVARASIASGVLTPRTVLLRVMALAARRIASAGDRATAEGPLRGA
jgi:uncharacterized protein